jgi:ankyrin repeat protein
MLVAGNAEVNQITFLGQALTLACSKGSFEMVRYLVSEGAHVNTDGSLDPPLVVACYGGYTHIAQFLITVGATTRPRQNYTVSCIEAAVLGGHVPTAELLLRTGLTSKEVIQKYPSFWEQVDRLHQERKALSGYIEVPLPSSVAGIILSFVY